MSGIDHLLQKLRGSAAGAGESGGAPASLPSGVGTAAGLGGAFFVTKLSWRGRYHRILVITPTHVLTFYPDSLALTNSWALAGDHDLAGVEVRSCSLTAWRLWPA